METKERKMRVTLEDSQIVEIARRVLTEKQRVLAAEFNVSQGTISRIATGKLTART